MLYRISNVGAAALHVAGIGIEENYKESMRMKEGEKRRLHLLDSREWLIIMNAEVNAGRSRLE
jgi:hypothetical protein